MLLQPIIIYNFSKGWCFTSVPVIIANWEADSDNRWTVPVGGGMGKIMSWGKQPVDLSLAGFYNVEQPNPLVGQGVNLDNQSETWTVRLQLKLLFPKQSIPGGLSVALFASHALPHVVEKLPEVDVVMDDGSGHEDLRTGAIDSIQIVEQLRAIAPRRVGPLDPLELPQQAVEPQVAYDP